jgi:hypothetical protein
LSCFYRSRRSGRLPLDRSLFDLRVVLIAPNFFTRVDLRKKVWVNFNLFFNSWHKIRRVYFWSCESRWGTNFAASHLMFKSTVKFRWQTFQLTPVASEISSIVYWGSSLILTRFFSTFSSVRLADWRPEWEWSSTLISPLLNRANHSKTCVRLSASWLKAFELFRVFLRSFFRDGNEISSKFALRYGQTSRFRERSLTTLGRIGNTSPYNLLRRRPPGYWLVKGATTLT